MARLNVLVADDHAVLRSGLRLLIDGQPDMTVAGEASSGEEAYQRTLELRPDIVLLDLSMPGGSGFETIRLIKRDVPSATILVLTMHDDEGYVRHALMSGAAGYLPKSAADVELLSALRAVAQGGVYLHPSQAGAIVSGVLARPRAPRGSRRNPHEALSERERQVLRLVALGFTNSQIAERACLSVKTVEGYRSRVMEKLALKNRAALVRYALNKGLLDEGD